MTHADATSRQSALASNQNNSIHVERFKQFSVQGPEMEKAEARSSHKDYFRAFWKINSC